MDKNRRICIDKIFGQPPLPYIASGKTHNFLREMPDVERAAVTITKMWPQRRTLRIRFLEGESYVQEKVKEMAKIWTDYSNLKFQFVDDKDADIQIAFQPGAGSWSTVGTDANTVNPGEATMNLGWLDKNTPDKEYSRVVKHEFGHAMGLIHEHENPDGSIQWNKPAVYHDLEGPPNNWDPTTVDHNMFERYNKNITQYTKVDPNSIMMYYIPSEWTLDHKSYGENVFDLSDMDKEFIKKVYPQ